MLQQLLDAATTRPAEALLLVLLPFLREDLAIVAGGMLIVEHRLPHGLALACLYVGIVASDLLLYGLGRLARRSARVRRLLLRPWAERIGDWLVAHAAAAMIVARILPGAIFPVYAGCGLARVRVVVFVPITMVTAALYMPALLWLVIRFGEGVLTPLGYWTWFVAILLVIVTIGWSHHPPWGVLLRVARSGLGSLVARESPAEEPQRASHRGMPSLRGLSARIGLAERIPERLFYAPIALNWLWLALRYRSISLPALANPLIEVGGLWGESKTVYLDMVAGPERRWLARYVTLARGEEGTADDVPKALALAREAGLGFPLVAKPDIGWQGYGVRRIASETELLAYVTAFPEGAALMLQEVVDWEGEAGVFYVRRPDEARGRVVALTLRYFPHVIGDGVRTLRDLILADERASWKAGLHLGLQAGHAGLSSEALDAVPGKGEVARLSFIGSMRVGGLYRDAGEHITPALSARFDAISRSMPEFHYGRYDIRFASIERLREGEDFRIIEINGAGADSISAYDPEMPLTEAYARLFAHQRLMFEIGARNRRRGWTPVGPLAMIRAARQQSGLIKRYPPSS